MNALSIVRPGCGIGPYRDPPDAYITYNGEIYNYLDVARDWEISLAAGDTDAHLVMRGVSAFGPSWLTNLDGMFAFGLYDGLRRRLILARDRFGEKPLYYTILPAGGIIFASEIKAIRAAVRLVRRPFEDWLAAEGPLGGTTPYRNVRLLDPGCALVVNLDTLVAERVVWWKLGDDGNRPATYDEARRTFDTRLRTLALRRRPADDFALLLSGGLDSAVLAHILRPPVLVTVRYPGTARYDEIDNARLMAERLHTELVVVEPTAAEFQERIRHIVKVIDHPVGNASLFSEYMAYEKIASLGIRVVIGGVGPDELLLGYVRHSLLLDGDGISARGRLHSYAPLTAKFARHAREKSSAAERYYRIVLRGPDFTAGLRRTVHEAFRDAVDAGQAMTQTDLAVSFPFLLLSSDKLASAFGVENRSPYLAHELAEFCFRLPLRFKRLGRYTKRILRDFAREEGLPRAIWAQVDKKGFASPIPEWLGGTLRAWAEARITLRERELGLAFRSRSGSGDPYDRSRFLALMTAMWLDDDRVAT